MTEIILRTDNLTKQFHGFAAVRDVSIAVRAGGVHALIGPNGAGKTTLFNLLTNFVKPTTGRIIFEGVDITGKRSDIIARQGISRSFQISAVFPQLTVLENLSIALQRRSGLSYKFWKHTRCLRDLLDRARELAHTFSLLDYGDVAAGQLSYGRKRALEIATTLAQEPRLVLLDEPMAGLAQEEIPAVTKIIADVARHTTVVMVEHNLAVVAEVSSFITVLSRGSVLAEGKYSDVASDPAVKEAYLGSAE